MKVSEIGNFHFILSFKTYYPFLPNSKKAPPSAAPADTIATIVEMVNPIPNLSGFSSVCSLASSSFSSAYSFAAASLASA